MSVPIFRAKTEKKYSLISLQEANRPALNQDIFHYLKRFTKNKALLLTALLQNPAGKTLHLSPIKNRYGQEIYENLRIINRLQNQDPTFLKNYPRYQNQILLFLINHIFLPPKSKLFSKSKAQYALQLLEKTNATDLRIELEDKLFRVINPQIYQSYQSLLNLTQKEYKKKQQEVTRDFKILLEKNNIKAQIQSRLKTIYSLHHKITRKNLLLSQILDTIGIRIIVETEDECYKVMVLILKNSPIMTSRIKDYIAIPKNNGYQSIHLTILHKEHPVEIQIRTKKMHHDAQYGTASHLEYKST